MSEALDLIHDTLDVFSGKKKSLKEPGLVDLMDTARNRERACRENCRFPSWAGGCPYLHVKPETCPYNGANNEEEENTVHHAEHPVPFNKYEKENSANERID